MPRSLAITVDSVRDELSGQGMEMFLTALGTPDQQTRIIEQRIGEAQSEIENSLHTYLFQQVIKSRPLDEGLVRGTDYTRLDDAYPFVRDDWMRQGRIKTYRRPIQSVQRVAIRYGQGPDVFEAVEYPRNWISFEGRLGVVNVIPIVGSATYGAGAMILLPMTGGPIHRASLPSLVTVDYTAGFLPDDFHPETEDPYDASPDYDVTQLLKAVRLGACIAVLKACERAIGAGGGSIGMFGLSESFVAGRFATETKSYSDDIADIKTQYLAGFSGPLICSS